MFERDAAAKREKYGRRVKAGLDRAFTDPELTRRDLDLDRDRLIVFSDHHRGARDGADDFWRCEQAYHAALGWYLEAGHHLYLLGDVEELWENPPARPMKAYADTLELEREFHLAGRLDRFWGNHDDTWRHDGDVEKHLRGRFPGLVVREALRLDVVARRERLGQLFLAHGHQGTLDSDRFSLASRVFVRYGWRPLQRHVNFASTTPARDYELRANHDQAMFEWARSRPEKPVLIAGHTHHPVFGGTTPPRPAFRPVEAVQSELEALRGQTGATPDDLATLRAELEQVRTKPYSEPPRAISPPCYYNTGCCSFGDGDVTGLEIADGKIRLVRWLDDEGKPKIKLLAEDDLRAVLRAVGATS